MKKLFLIMSAALLMAILLSSCEGCEGPNANNEFGTKKMEQKEGEGDKKDKPDTAHATVMQPVVETIQMPDPSYEEFLKSLTAFSAGNMKEAAAHLGSGTHFLKKELGDTKGITKKRADKIIKKLETLEAQVEQGKIKDENIISATLADAEAVTAHNYIFKQGNTNENDIVPNITVQHIDTLHLLLSRVNNFERGAAKEKGTALLKENESIRSLTAAGKIDTLKMKEHLQKVKDYLEKRQ